MHPESVRRRAREVLGYFLRNPRAADTVEGLVRWRLLDDAIRQGVHDTNRALALLVARGILVEEAPPGSQPVFRLNSESVQAARQFWASLADGSADVDGNGV